MIYLNPQCEGDISGCDLANADHVVTDYFDFSLPSEEVNAKLNSQQLPGN